MKREVNLVAEPGERVEVRDYSSDEWIAGEVEEVWAKWYRGNPDAFTHYRVSHADPDLRRDDYPAGRIRKPQAAPEQ